MLACPSAALGWGEVDVHTVPGGGATSCVRAAGGAGLVSAIGPLGRRTTPFDLLTASSDGLADAGRARFGVISNCGSVAANDSGTLLLAMEELPTRVSVTLREPGAPARDVVFHDARTPVAAVGPAGDAAVAWIRPERTRRASLFVARHAPGAGFGPPQRVARWKETRFSQSALTAVAIDAAGNSTVAWARQAPPRNRVDNRSVVETAVAGRGAAFGPSKRVGGAVQDLTAVALDVTPDGADTLLAFDGSWQVQLFERRQDAFTLLHRYEEPELGGVSGPSLAQAPDGSAVLAWRTTADQDLTGGVKAVRRAGRGPFGDPATLARGVEPRSFSSIFVGLDSGQPYVPLDDGGGNIGIAMRDDGAAVVSWLQSRRAIGERRVRAPFAAFAPASGGFEPASRLGSPCRPPSGVAALLTADGRLGAVFTDSVSRLILDVYEQPVADGRIHLALADAPRPAVAEPPAVTVNAPRSVRLRHQQPLRVRVHCDRACDIRAVAVADGVRRAVGMASLSRAGTARVRLHTGGFRHVAPRGGGVVRVIASACSPNGPLSDTAETSVRALRRPVPPLVLPVDLRARRRGRKVVVTWRTERPARRSQFLVFGGRTRKSAPSFGDYVTRRGRGRTHFRVVLRGRRARGVRWVTVIAGRSVPPFGSKLTVVRVR